MIHWVEQDDDNGVQPAVDVHFERVVEKYYVYCSTFAVKILE